MQQLSEEKKKGQELPIFNITREGFQELQKSSLTLDQLFFLECCYHKVEVTDLVSKDKFLTWKQSLIRRGFIIEEDKELKLTSSGKTILQLVGSGQPFKEALEEKDEDLDKAFDRWWIAYPRTDTFVHKGIRFNGSRALRTKKKECKSLIRAILDHGEFTIDDLIGGLEYEILQKKEKSFKTKENEMHYMSNSHSYLLKRGYEGFIDLMKEEGTTSKTQTFEDI